MTTTRGKAALGGLLIGVVALAMTAGALVAQEPTPGPVGPGAMMGGATPAVGDMSGMMGAATPGAGEAATTEQMQQMMGQCMQMMEMMMGMMGGDMSAMMGGQGMQGMPAATPAPGR